jgi:hypothetical protein
VNEWVCGNCKSINRAAAGSCYSCGGSRAAVAAADPRLAPVAQFAAAAPADDGPGFAAMSVAGASPSGAMAGSVAVDPGAMTGFGETIAAPAPAPAQPATMSDLLGGLLAGVVAAVLATVIWYAVVANTHFQVGIVAIAVGFIVGQGVVLGARRHTSIALVAISVVLTLLALVVSEYLIVAHFASQQLGFEVELMQPPDFIAGVVSDSLGADPLTLVFWAIALFQAFVIPWRSMRDR